MRVSQAFGKGYAAGLTVTWTMRFLQSRSKSVETVIHERTSNMTCVGQKCALASTCDKTSQHRGDHRICLSMKHESLLCWRHNERWHIRCIVLVITSVQMRCGSRVSLRPAASPLERTMP
jgi:hypothetical protein